MDIFREPGALAAVSFRSDDGVHGSVTVAGAEALSFGSLNFSFGLFRPGSLPFEKSGGVPEHAPLTAQLLSLPADLVSSRFLGNLGRGGGGCRRLGFCVGPLPREGGPLSTGPTPRPKGPRRGRRWRNDVLTARVFVLTEAPSRATRGRNGVRGSHPPPPSSPPLACRCPETPS